MANLFSLHKGIGKIPENFKLHSSNHNILNLHWNLIQEDVSFPVAVLDIDNLEDNLNWMEEFLSNYNNPKVLLSPHGKTSMMPSLFKKVIDKPSTWGITVATATQGKVANMFGISNILLANQLVGRRNMEIISEMMEDNKSLGFMCLVDSPTNVNQLGEFFSAKQQKVKVLIELGPLNGRTGIRNENQLSKILESLKQWQETVKLVGVEFFEGILKTQESVENFIDSLTPFVKRIHKDGAFQQQSIILTGAGSVWFDIVSDKLTTFSKQNEELQLEIIIRPGCYMIHDIGLYDSTASRIRDKNLVTSSLKTTLRIWAYVQSIPERNLAIIGFGKRDAANDCGYPKPALHFRPGIFDKPIDILQTKEEYSWEVFNMMDQHTFMKIGEGDDIQVGDIIAFDILHPCTNIDKWRNVLVMNKNYDVVDIIPTYF